MKASKRVRYGGLFCAQNMARSPSEPRHSSPDLLQMPALVDQIIIDQESQRYGRFVSHGTLRFQPVFRNMVDNRHENLVLGFPPTEKRLPRLIRVAVSIHPGILRVPRPSILTIGCGAHEPLPIVCGRIEQVTDNLLPRPAAIPPGQVGKFRWNRNEGSMDFIQICAKSLRQAIRHFSHRTPI